MLLARRGVSRIHSYIPQVWRCYATRSNFPASIQKWSQSPSTADIGDDEVARLASTPRKPLTLADLVQYGPPPLSEAALLSSANFALSLIPARLAYRIQSLRNLPFIVVSNPHISQIYNNYLHSLTTLLPYQRRQITTLEEEAHFTEVMADLVQTHSNTIPLLARGFLECRKYINPVEVTRFLEEHLRVRIGTRLIAEQHIALHMESQPEARNENLSPPHYIGVIDTALCPADIVRSCEEHVSEICELKYGVRPSLIINGQPQATLAHVPVHLEYILTELLKNAFRATIESGREREPIEVTIAAASDVPSHSASDLLKQLSLDHSSSGNIALENTDSQQPEKRLSGLDSAAPSITIRIRDKGGGIPPDVLPNIWSYSFTTFGDKEAVSAENAGMDGLNVLSGSGGNQSSIAGLGYGLPLGRAYAEYFGGGIAVQSLFGWGTDVYLTLQGVGKVVE